MPIQTASIISVYPRTSLERTRHNGPTEYLLPAADRDKIITVTMNPDRMFNRFDPDTAMYQVTEKAAKPGRGYTELVVCDTCTWIRDPQREGDSRAGAQLIRMPISAEECAQSLVEVFNAGRPTMREGGSRGIALRTSEPLDDQLNYLYAELTTLARTMVQDGDAFFQNREWKSILPIHRDLCKWLGVVREWSTPMERQIMKTCKACGREILSQALVCQHCGVHIIEFAQRYGMDLSDDPVASNVLAGMAKAPKAVNLPRS